MVNNSQTLRAELEDKGGYYKPYIQDYHVLWSLLEVNIKGTLQCKQGRVK